MSWRPPRRWTWALRVPTLVSCYFSLICFIDTPFRLQDRWIRMLPHSWIGCRLYVSLYLCSGPFCHDPFPELSPISLDLSISSDLLQLLLPSVHRTHRSAPTESDLAVVFSCIAPCTVAQDPVGK